MTTRTRNLSPWTIAAALGQFPPTEEQAAVIAAPMSPALVVAGAGSGKTETMAGRVVWLVANGLVRREHVLGLTFTRKAAGELTERIQKRLRRLAEFETRGLVPHLGELHASGRLDIFGALEASDSAGDGDRHAALDALVRDLRRDDDGLGDSGAPAGLATDQTDQTDTLMHRPTVATYNSFADAIVREHAVRVGRDAEAAVLSESAAWLLMRRVVLDSDDVRLEVREEALRSIIDAALRIARDGVDNLVDFDELARFPDRFADVLLRPSESKRVTVYADVAKAANNVGGLALLVALAGEYRARKLRQGVIDFSDQVAGALEVVRSHPIVAAELKDRYRVILLDEYQDTSVVQTDLLAALFAGTAVMAVGDPHQSIYGWRGASAGNLGDFRTAFTAEPDAEYALLTSWRNSDQVLAAANAVLAPLAHSSPVPVRELRARPGAPRGTVDIVYEDDLDAEADRVAHWFEDARAARAERGAATTGAILFRSKKHMTRFGDALARRGIPHRILGLGGLLSTPEVVDVIAALRVISDPTAGSALIRLLAGPRWEIGLADLRALADLSRRIARHDSALQPLSDEVAERLRSSGGQEAGSLVDALDFVLRHPPEHGWLNAITPDARARLSEAGAVFAGLRRSATLPIPELVRLIELELRLDLELAANESRGPARLASDQLRAFVDELHGFLAADETGSLTSLLAWLDHAERLDEFAPRTEPPEDDVVQLLTIHGSKGLEWDAVAVVRFVTDELPTAAKDTKGWLGFGVLPYEFRGDARWLPRFDWDRSDSPTQQDLKSALERFVADQRSRQLGEDRRLAYVAVTRARDALLLSGSAWSGTKTARAPSPFLVEIADALGETLAADRDPGENPYLGTRRVLEWPIDPLGARRDVVERAAESVRAAQEAPPARASRDLELLLAERAARASGQTRSAPTRIPASRYKDFVADFDQTVAAIARPMPERPYRQTRTGTLFHAWVEERSGIVGPGSSADDALWETDDEVDGEGRADEPELQRLKEKFLASEWADLQPLEVETEINFSADDVLPDGRPHVVICKIDAVYQRGDRIEIVDWKTGRPPRIGRRAGGADAAVAAVPARVPRQTRRPARSDRRVLYYVADDLVLRG